MVRHVSAPVVSPDGQWLVWQQGETDLGADTQRYDLWRLDLGVKGAKPEKLVAERDVDESSPQFSRDSRMIWFQSNKGGEDNVWSIPVAGGTANRVTDLKGGLGGFKVSPTEDRLLIWADRLPGAQTSEPPAVKKAEDAGNGRVYDQLFVRHWSSWSDGTRSQLFVLPIVQGRARGFGVAIEGKLGGDSPSKPFGGGEEVSWSADGKTVYFALREAGRMEPLSTNLDIFSTPVDGSAEPVNLTKTNLGTDTLPTVSPDGKSLAWIAKKRAGYESDRSVLMIRDLASGTVRSLSEQWDRTPETIAWCLDSQTIYVTTHDMQDVPAFAIALGTGKVTRLTQEGTVSAVAPFADGLVYAMNTLTAPDDFFELRGGKVTRLTAVNASRLAGIDMPIVTRFSFVGAKGDTVWGYAMKPPGIAKGAKVPIAYMVHGGPQDSASDSFLFGWNAAVIASAGYGVVATDFHGSIGYGQAFTESVSGHWGSYPLEDLEKGLDAATTRFPWLDASNACALGGSFGGYMMNWVEGMWPDRFKCIVQHDGMFDLRSWAYETEELWYADWEHGGRAYYEDPAAFEKWNPVNLVSKWKTPQLVITSEGDFRVPYTQGLAAFTALQQRGIPSKLIVFPGGSHLIVAPKERRQWYQEVLAWLGRWTDSSAKR
jgi:dipeptidyl aminopeptidase/acylaminoacyl peptidase